MRKLVYLPTRFVASLKFIETYYGFVCKKKQTPLLCFNETAGKLGKVWNILCMM